jgi:pyruvate dehydrogenase E1 component alpha subunit
MAVADQLVKPPAAATRTEPGASAKDASNGSAERERLRMMMLIRKFEERTVQEYQRPGQRIGGFCHVYSGQEAIAVGIASLFQQGKDHLINGYRCHGHSLALGMTPRAAMAELFGKATGCSKGKGGSMHFFQADHGNHGGHGIVGGHIPLGLGLAFSQKYKATGGVTFCLFGDGAINQGTFNESLNLASLYKVPAIFIVENNGVAMGTQIDRSSAEKDLVKRGSGFAMPCRGFDGNDIDVVMKEMGQAIERGRRGEGPTYLVANTYRFRGHSMSDPMKYRKTSDGKWLPEVEEARRRDPIVIYESRLKEKGLIDEPTLNDWDEQIRDIVDDAVKFADSSPEPELSEMYTDILSENYPYQPE